MNTNSKNFTPRITVAALRGGSGKTITSLGLARALAEQGHKIATFKKGPDYIDAAWLGMAAGRACRNLDPFLMTQQTIIRSFLQGSAGSNLAIIEGNRGLFDGVNLQGGFSTAELAKTLGSPVLLVVDCQKVTRTMAAMICGCRDFDPGTRILGVILNRVAGSRHETMLRQSIEEYAQIPVLGKIPRMKKDPLPMRHLGLTPADEYAGPEKALDLLAAIIRENLDINRLLKLARESATTVKLKEHQAECSEKSRFRSPVRIGVIRDAAFQFYYPENLEALEREGAELVFLNAISDRDVPDIDALYIGGGFPETQAEQLSANREFMEPLRNMIENGLPVYAECGGLMYLGRNLLWKDRSYPMLGVLDWDFVLKKRPVGHGYSILDFVRESPFFPAGDVLRGHEFHYSLPVRAGNENGYFCCRVQRGHGFDGRADGFCYKNVFGTYTHIHGLGNEQWAARMAAAALKYKRRRLSACNDTDFPMEQTGN